MGLGTTIMVFTLVASWALLVVMPAASPFNSLAQTFGTQWQGEMSSVANNTAQTQSGTQFFPNPYALFSGVFTGIIGFATFPVSIWLTTGLPDELKTLLSLIFGVLYALAIMSWLKGGDTP